MKTPSSSDAEVFDAIVIGSGLAGMTVALQILDDGGSVTMIEKEPQLGGNSIKASSGINACVPSPPENTHVSEEEIESFIQDTMKSAGDRAKPELVRILVENSAESLQWLADRLLDSSLFEKRTRLGGHSRDRTHRPVKGTIGFGLISAMQKVVEEYKEKGSLRIFLSTRATELIQEKDRVTGVRALQRSEENTSEEMEIMLRAKNVVLATGGFAAERGKDSYLARFAPQYLEMPATFGDFSTGDGISMAEPLGAGKIDMDKVQIHPTGFVDLDDPDNPTKILCAELMRGIGGILLNGKGHRFCNELGARDYITGKMMEQRNRSKDAVFFLLIPASAAQKADAHIGFYSWKRLLRKLEGIEKVAELASVDPATLRRTLTKYRDDANAGKDEYGKTNFPDPFQDDFDTATYYIGSVTPVMHYCMGGLKMSRRGEILDENNQVIPGLYGAGEVTGGVHGSNRLAGNSLLECLVFGRIVGTQIASNKKKKTVAAVSVVAKTAIDAIYAKHSAIRAGYNPMVPDQQELYEELLEDMTVRMEQCRYDDISQQPSKRRQQTALVNAGYASRVLAMSHRIQSFLLYHQMTAVAGRKTNIQLIFLGCGLDVIGLWAAKSFKPPQSSWLDLTVVEVDMMEIYHFKRDILKSSGNHDMVQNLTEHFGAGAGSDDNRHCTGRIGYARNEEQNDSIEQDCHYHNYLLIPTDLTKDLPRLDAILQDPSIPFSATSSTLIISELVLAYLPPSGTDTLLMWCADKFASIPGSAIVAIEPLGCDKLAAGAGDVVAVEDGYRRDYCRKFQDKMQRGRNTNNGDSICGQTLFHPMGTSLKNVTWRLQEAGFCKASTTSLGIAATLAAAATSPSKTLNCPEIFDEHAALALHLQSYVVTCGVSCATSNEGDAMLFGRVMCPWECGSNTLKLARSCLPWFDCYDKMVYTEIQPEHDSQVCSLFEITYQEYVEDYPAIRKMVKGVLKKELNAMHSMRTASNEKGFNEFTRSSSIAEFYRSNKGIFLVAVRYGIEDGEHDKEVVGFVGIRSCEAKNVENGTMEIFRLAVHKRYRRRGIARNLLAAVEMFALDQCCPKIVANTLTILDAACNLYASHGFMAEKVASLGPQLQMTTFVKIPFAYTDDASDKSTDFVKLTHDDSREEQSDYDRLGYEQAEPTLHLRRRGSLLGHIMAWADKVNEEHMGPSFGQLNDCESLGSNYRRSRLDYGRRASLDVTSTDTDFTNKRNRRRIHSSDNFNNSGSDENSSIEPRRVGSGRRNSLDAFVEQAVAYRNLRPDPSDDEMCPFGTRRDSLF